MEKKCKEENGRKKRIFNVTFKVITEATKKAF